uniref:Transcription factor MafA n=1 Tax=Lygus hesperus TaxID=30085 RepID=A0A0A9YAR8_LYGHE
MDPTDDKMEPEENNHLAESYVADFVLDHLEQVAVKKEGGGMERLPSSLLQCSGGVVMSSQSPPPPSSHLLTPPGQHPGDEYGVVGVGPHPGMVMNSQCMLYPDTPGTPPDTPPESNSPHSPIGRHFPMDPQVVPQYQRVTPAAEDVSWIMANNGLRHEPLDLRPNGPNEMGMEEWSHLQQAHHQSIGKRISNGLDYHHQHHMHHQHSLDSDDMSGSPMSMSGPMSCRPLSDTPRSTHSIDDLINDELLMCLSVRELNKRLHGFPREDVVRLKQKRRTLKNRGYAQNCRSKRLHQRHELELTNRSLQNEVQLLRRERDMYKHRFESLMKKFEFATATAHGSPIASPDIYERFQ